LEVALEKLAKSGKGASVQKWFAEWAELGWFWLRE
jgi:hypothetical protein